MKKPLKPVTNPAKRVDLREGKGNTREIRGQIEKP